MCIFQKHNVFRYTEWWGKRKQKAPVQGEITCKLNPEKI